MFAYAIYDNEPQTGRIVEIIERRGGFLTEGEAEKAANEVLDNLGDDNRYSYYVCPVMKRGR